MIIGHYEHNIWAPGGIATYIRQLGAVQRAAGHTVLYFSQTASSQKLSDLEQPILVPVEATLFTQAQALGVDVLHLHTFVDTPPPDNLKVIRTLHVHHPYCPSGGKFLGRWNRPCSRPYSIPGCLWGHLVDHCGSIRPQNLYQNFRHTWDDQKILPQIPVVTVSQFLKDEMTRSGYPENSIQVLPLFAQEKSDYMPPPQDGIPRFVFLGRIVPQKGLDWLLQSLQKVSGPVCLDVAGEGYLEPELRRLSKKLGIDDRVLFHGWVKPDKVRALIESARAVIFPSIWPEPAGFVALEAATYGRAVIGAKVGAIPEYANQLQNALLVEPGNSSALALAITRLGEDWSLATQLGENGRAKIRQCFSPDDHLKRLMQIYNGSSMSLKP